MWAVGGRTGRVVRADRCARDAERREVAYADAAISEVAGEFTRRVRFDVGYDHRSFPGTCGGGGHGQHGMEVTFLLIGGLGAVQFKFNMPPFVPGVPLTFGTLPVRYPDIGAAVATDLGHHWKTPTYPDEMRMECDFLDQGHCYYDGSGMNAEPVLAHFISDGPRAVWADLESYYRLVAGREEPADAPA